MRVVWDLGFLGNGKVGWESVKKHILMFTKKIISAIQIGSMSLILVVLNLSHSFYISVGYGLNRNFF